MPSKSLRTLGVGCLWSCVIYPVVGALGWLCVHLPVHPLLSLLLAAVLFLGGPLVFIIWMSVRLGRQLNAAFGPLDLRGSMYLLGRQYHGEFAERRVDVYFGDRSLLAVYLATPLKTRLRLETRDVLRRPLGSRRMELDDPDLGHLDLYAMDEDWARTLLADPVARAAVLRLSRDEGLLEAPLVQLQPGAFVLKLIRPKVTKVTPERARFWLVDLLTLAQVAESLPPPRQAVEASWFERTSHTDPSRIFRIMVKIGVAVFGIVAVVLIALLVVLILTQVKCDAQWTWS